METKAVAAWQPEWDVELDELQATHRVMTIDTRQATRAVRVPAETPAEIEALFDALAYEKGAAVIGMTESFAGQTAWQHAVHRYIENHQYGNATAEDFWTTAAKVTAHRVDRIMRSFVDRPGVPLVTLETACDGEQLRVTLFQEPFARAAPDATPWVIPVCLDTRGDAASDSCHLLDTREGSVTLPGCSRWVVGNNDAEGYYRTHHGRDALARLIKANVALAPDERLMLIADEWALMRAGKADLVSFLQVTRALAADTQEPAVLSALAARLQFVHEYLTTERSRDAFESWVRELSVPALESARKRVEHTDATRARRAALIGLAGAVGRDREVLSEATRQVRRYLQGETTSLPADILDAQVGLAALAGDADLYALYRQRAEQATTPEERYRFLYALAAFREPALIRRTLDYAQSDNVRPQDRALLLGRILLNPVARPLAWQAIKAHWQELQSGLGGFGAATRIIEALGAFCEAHQAEDIRAFFEAHPVPGADRALRQTLEDIDACAAVAATQRPRLETALAASRDR